MFEQCLDGVPGDALDLRYGGSAMTWPVTWRSLGSSGSGGDGRRHGGEQALDLARPPGAEDEVACGVDPEQVATAVATSAATGRRGCGPGFAVVVEPPEVAVLG